MIKPIDKLPGTLQVLPKLQELLGDDDAIIDDIVMLIEKDASLVFHIVKMSDSAYYASSTSALTVVEAMNRVGFAEAYKMVGVVAAGEILSGGLPVYNMKSGELWETSLMTASLMQYLANISEPLRVYALPTSGIAYTIGLLHSVGKMVISHYHENIGLEGLEGLSDSLTPQLEEELLGFDNCEAGALLLQKWKFSNDLTVSQLSLRVS